eukprot:m.867919 g.867919  ORF g.867919 m.867919 type:complete len:355 (-) comp23556_c1_seq4:2768-3832(-)
MSKPTMSPEDAQRLFTEGAILVLLDVPTGTEFGIDYNSWNVGPMFKGVKMIPPGLHFVFYSATGADGKQSAPRTGFFFNARPQQIIVKRWNPDTEDLDDAPRDEEQLNAHRAGIITLDPCLGAFPYDDGLRKFRSLSSGIDVARDLQRLTPRCGKICSVPAQHSSESTHVDDSGAHARDTTMGFVHVPKRTYPTDATPADVTKYSIDKSHALETMLGTLGNDPDALLAELQFAFIAFLLGQVFEAFDHWKQLVGVLCGCEEALYMRPKLFYDFLGVLLHQLHETPTDFFVDVISRENFFAVALQGYFAIVRESPTLDAELTRRSHQLQKFVTARFQWDFDEEVDEDKPLVVEET